MPREKLFSSKSIPEDDGMRAETNPLESVTELRSQLAELQQVINDQTRIIDDLSKKEDKYVSKISKQKTVAQKIIEMREEDIKKQREREEKKDKKIAHLKSKNRTLKTMYQAPVGGSAPQANNATPTDLVIKRRKNNIRNINSLASLEKKIING